MRFSDRIPAAWCRIFPYLSYLVFLGLEAASAGLGEWLSIDARWLYPAKALAVALVLIWLWSRYDELLSLPSLPQAMMGVVAGAVVWGLWISLDHGWMTLGESDGYDPRTPEGGLDVTLVAFRLMGAVLVVPLMEELFWRSFTMRWIARQSFLTLAPGAIPFSAFVISAVLFGLQHHLWLAGIIAGVAYGLLYVRTGNLWVSVIAHAVTNALLGAWVLANEAWRFW